MDARITRSRLGNFLAYEWLKIVAVAAGAILLFMILFTSFATRVTTGQRFSIYGFTDLASGPMMYEWGPTFVEKKQFSYEIMETSVEAFSSAEQYQDMMLTTRRSTGDGDVMFISNLPDKEGKSSLSTLMQMYPEEKMALDPQKYFAEAEVYLNGFFNGDWREGELNENAVERAFRKRNVETKDKRFKNEEQIANGIVQEEARVKLLRDDLKVVLGELEKGENGLISYTTVEYEDSNKQKVQHRCAIDVGTKLTGVVDYFYYWTEKEGAQIPTCNAVNVILFNNNKGDGDLRYESISFLRYLIKTCAPAV